jgi:exodeoxyribonuclease V beta subunit
LSRFQDYFQLWQEQGLLTMLQTLLKQEQVEVHLCAQVQAERALTNLHHIIERLQQAAIDEHLAINKTLDWLHLAILQAPQDSSEDRQLRLESDEDAVKIVTLHSSKGLEYPLVFCPSLWQRNDRLKNEKNLIQCHENGEMIADLGSEQFAARRDVALSEELAEDLRLLYVAVTRAQYRCYIAWADVRSKEKSNDSALAYLLEFANADFAAQQNILKALLAEQPQSFAYQLLPAESVVSGHYQSPNLGRSLSCRRQSRSLKTHWQMSSYTALSALSLHDAPELPEDKAEELAEVEIGGALPEAELESGIVELPRGAQMGNVVHSLLEHNSFQSLAAGIDNKRVFEQALSEYGLGIKHAALLETLLQTVVSAPLSADLEFRLDKLHDQQCLKEMPFYLAMQDIDVARINRILAESPAYQALSSKQLCGYLTGFIDLICEYRGKYYVMDYKTNTLPDYRSATLLQAMRQHNYGLQYWLYCLVLHRYLQQRLAGYEYARHFGGVKYLFVRGMRVDVPGVGVFADLPAEGVIDELGGVFFGRG